MVFKLNALGLSDLTGASPGAARRVFWMGASPWAVC